MLDLDENTIIYNSDIDRCIHIFFENESEEDIRNETQSRWLACMMYIYNSLYKTKKRYKNDTSKSKIDINDLDTIEKLLFEYYYICLLYNKEISLFSFSVMTGLPRTELIDKYGNRATLHTLDIIKTTNEYRHESLKSLLLQGGKTQFGATVILNHDYDYNLPGSNRDVVERRKLNKSDIAEQLGISLENAPMLKDNDNI